MVSSDDFEKMKEVIMFWYCWEKMKQSTIFKLTFLTVMLIFVNNFWVVILLWYEMQNILRINFLYIFGGGGGGGVAGSR